MKQLKIFFFSSALLLVTLTALVYSIDPYDRYGFNVFKFATKAVAMSRENKFNLIEYQKKQYDVFQLGSSAAHRFNTEDIVKATGMSAFNYAVQHSYPEDYLAITRHILQHQSPKMILLQLDFDALNRLVKTDPRLYSSPLKEYLNPDRKNKDKEKTLFDSDYFTLGALNDSFKVVWVNFFNKARHQYTQDGNYIPKETATASTSSLTRPSKGDYVICERRVNFLRELQKLCDQHHVRLVVWMTPFPHEITRQIMEDPDQKKIFDAYVSTLTGVFKEVHNTTTIAKSEYTNGFYFEDALHPARPLAKIILSQVFAH